MVLALRDVLVVVVPIIAAIAFAYQLSLHDQRTRAQVMADLVLNRSELTTGQLADAFKKPISATLTCRGMEAQTSVISSATLPTIPARVAPVRTMCRA